VTATEKVGRNIRRIRRAADLSQEAAAERAGLHREGLSVYETGRQEAKLETILKIAGGIGVEPGVLFDGVRWDPGRFARGVFVIEEDR
jgi:transcriptional regulator with XRE-family HTH domain